VTSPSGPSKQLIIQLARFGDLLQLAPLTAELGTYSELHLLVDSSLEATARLLPNVAKFIAIPRTDALKLMMQDDLAGLTGFWGDVADTLRHEHYDRVVNVTHTPESGLLSRMTACRDVRGAYYDRRGLTTSDPWERLFRATLSRRDFSGFHLVDYHRLSAGCETPFNIHPERSGSTFNSTRISLQLGANSPLRRWPVESFVRLAQAVHTVHPVQFTLLGATEESPLAAEFLSRSGLPALDLTGKTKPSELAEALRESDLLISGDTGTIHLAALVGTGAVGIYLGMARPDDTAPYQQGAVIFEPRTSCYPCSEHNLCGHLSCHGDVPVEAVASTVFDLLNGRAITPEDTPDYRRRLVELDEHGLLTLRGATITASDRRRSAMKNLWLSEFTDKQLAPTGVLEPADMDGLSTFADLATRATTTARTFRTSMESGSPDRPLLKQIQSNLTQIESHTIQPSLTGLLAQMFSLEIERPPADPTKAIHLIESSIASLSRRCHKLVADLPPNSQLSTLNFSAGAA